MNLTLTLAVADLDRTAAFYRDLLQLPLRRVVPIVGQPPIILLGVGDATIIFREAASFEARHPALFQNLDRHVLGVGVLLEIPSKSLKTVERNLDRRGVHILYELQDEQHKRREIWVHDPDGYLVALREEKPE
jgi:catechol 2,3-dioxygenase-like lactoylglutathione lyase family enzyme